MALKPEEQDALKELGLDIEKLKTAFTSDDEVEVGVPKGLFIPEADRADYDKRIGNKSFNEGKVAGVEMAVKEWKQKEGIEIEGKSLDVLIPALKEKVLKDAKIEPEIKVRELTQQLTNLQQTYTTDITAKESEIAAVRDQLKSTRLDSTLQFHVPEKLTGIKPNQFIRLAKDDFNFDFTETGSIVATDKTGKIIVDKLQKPVPVSDVLLEYAITNSWTTKDGRGGGDNPGGTGGGKFKTERELYAYMEKEKIQPSSEQGKQLVDDFLKSK